MLDFIMFLVPGIIVALLGALFLLCEEMDNEVLQRGQESE